MFSFVWKRRSDTDRIEGIRRNMRAMHRLRPWFIGFYSLMAIAFLAFSWAVSERLAAINPNNPGQVRLGFTCGIVVGAFAGTVALKIAHGLVMALFGYRNERLLLRYYDAFQAIARGEINALPVSGDEGVP